MDLVKKFFNKHRYKYELKNIDFNSTYFNPDSRLELRNFLLNNIESVLKNDGKMDNHQKQLFESILYKLIDDQTINIPNRIKNIKKLKLDNNGNPQTDSSGNVIYEHKATITDINELHDIPSIHLNDDQKNVICRMTTRSKEYMYELENELNHTLKKQWYKKYIAAAFWSHIYTPINLAITLLTTFTTGQAATNTLFSQSTFIHLSIAALVISTINTFFQPHVQVAQNKEALTKWQELGSKYEKIYFSPSFNNNDYNRRIKDLSDLQTQIHDEKIAQDTKMKSYFTDSLFRLFTLFSRKELNWIIEDRQIHKQSNTNYIDFLDFIKSHHDNDSNSNNSSVSIDIDPDIIIKKKNKKHNNKNHIKKRHSDDNISTILDNENKKNKNRFYNKAKSMSSPILNLQEQFNTNIIETRIDINKKDSDDEFENCL